jgi:hypothetical protein
MGWFQRRRERKARELAEACRIAVAAAQPPADPKTEALDMLKLINELGRGRLEVIKLDNELERERLRLEAEDRKIRRQEEQEAREKDRERRAKQSADAKDQRAREKIRKSVAGLKPAELDADMSDCEECQSALAGRKPLHTFDMLRHAEKGHQRRLVQLLQSQKNGEGSNASPAN